MQKSNKLKGIVKLITIKEQDLKRDLSVITYDDGRLKIGNLEFDKSKNSLYSVEFKDYKEGEHRFNYTALDNLKTLVIKYKQPKEYGDGTYNGKLIQLPIKLSQWQKILDNNEIGKEVEFVIQEKSNQLLRYARKHNESYDYKIKYEAKIIPSKVDKALERYNEAIQYIRDNGDNEPLNSDNELLHKALKIAAGI